MGLRLRKSIKAGPVRINLSKSGIGYSVGTKGFRVTKTANGRVRQTASIPGTGISYVKETSGKKKNTDNSPKNENVADESLRGGNEKMPKKKGSLLKKILIVLAVIVGIAIINGIINGSPKLEELKISGIVNPMDVNEQKRIYIDTTPEDINVDGAELKSDNSDVASLTFKDGKLYLNTDEEGMATVWVEKGDVVSNKVKVTVIDEKKAEAEAKTKEEEAKAKEEADAKAEQEQQQVQQSTPPSSSSGTSSSSGSSSNGGSSSQSTTVTPPAEEPSVPSDTTSSVVYIAGSGSGTKYHSNPNCSNMKNPVEISLSDAQSRGFTPCKKCY